MYKTAAEVTIHRAPEMTKEAREEVAKWLREQADELVSRGEVYADTLVARYQYEDMV